MSHSDNEQRSVDSFSRSLFLTLVIHHIAINLVVIVNLRTIFLYLYFYISIIYSYSLCISYTRVIDIASVSKDEYS